MRHSFPISAFKFYTSSCFYLFICILNTCWICQGPYQGPSATASRSATSDAGSCEWPPRPQLVPNKSPWIRLDKTRAGSWESSWAPCSAMASELSVPSWRPSSSYPVRVQSSGTVLIHLVLSSLVQGDSFGAAASLVVGLEAFAEGPW